MSSVQLQAQTGAGRRAELPAVLAVAQGDPLDPGTWSGTSASLFAEFNRRGQLVGTVDTSLPRAAELLARAVTVHPHRATWRERSSLGRLRAGAGAALARRGTRTAGTTGTADAVLQIGSWNRVPAAGNALRAVYLDSAIAQLLARPQGAVDPGSSFARWRTEYERHAYAEADLIFTMSEWTRRSLVDELGVPAAKVVLARPGPNALAPDPQTASEPATTPQGWRGTRGPHLLFVGKKWERKGGPGLLSAFARLRRTHPDALLSVVGPTEELPPSPGVRFWGRLDRDDRGAAHLFQRLFATADLFVMPSRYEPFGMVFVEAMSQGIACVGAAHCAMPEIITDGVTGRLVPPGDTAALAEVLIELADSPQTVAQMGNLARADAAARYTWADCVDVMNDAFAGAGWAGS